MPRNQSFEESEERKQRSPDPGPDPDPAQATGPIAAESWGKVIEMCPGDSGRSHSRNGVSEETGAVHIAARRAVLVERLDEARELGLGAVFEAAIAATAPEAGNSPTVVDDEVLRDRIAALDAALEQLEAKSAEQ